jgi:hypothetical protein
MGWVDPLLPGVWFGAERGWDGVPEKNIPLETHLLEIPVP